VVCRGFFECSDEVDFFLDHIQWISMDFNGNCSLIEKVSENVDGLGALLNWHRWLRVLSCDFS